LEVEEKRNIHKSPFALSSCLDIDLHEITKCTLWGIHTYEKGRYG